MENNEKVLGEADFQIISEQELIKIKKQNNKNYDEQNNNDEDITDILKETGIYEELDEETKDKLKSI